MGGQVEAICDHSGFNEGTVDVEFALESRSCRILDIEEGDSNLGCVSSPGLILHDHDDCTALQIDLLNMDRLVLSGHSVASEKPCALRRPTLENSDFIPAGACRPRSITADVIDVASVGFDDVAFIHIEFLGVGA